MLRKLILALVMAACLAMPAGRALAAEEHTSTAAAGHEEQKPPLLPSPFEKEPWIEALWTVIIFIVLLAVLYPTAWKSVLAGLKKREERIRNDIAEAEASRAKAEATLREYNTQLAAAETRVREMVNTATKDGERIATEIRMRAQKDSEEAKTRATKEIESAKTQALAEIYQRAAELSTSIAEKILRRSINAEDQKDLVKRSLDELQSVGR
jgi:F-type H+-transporting ATPase subunit b